MSKPPRVSEAEWKVMEIVWESPPVTAHQVLVAVAESTGWKAQTVKTLLGRLVKKRAIRYETEANRYLYSPCFTREETVAAETDTFLDRILKDSAAPLLSHLVQSSRDWSAEEIAELRKLLDEASNKTSSEPEKGGRK